MYNSNLNKEVWDYIPDPIFKKISTPNILDIGSGPGNVFFHFYHKYKKIKYMSVEEKTIQEVEKEYGLFRFYCTKTIEEEIDWQFNRTEKYDLYEYYKHLIDKKIIKPEKNNILNKNEFQKLFIKKVEWSKKIKDFFKENSLYNEFDLIILSKVIHYQCLNQSELLIRNNCYQALKTNGIIFISVQKNIGNNNRYNYDENNLLRLTTHFKEIDSNLHKENKNKELLFYLGSKYGI